MGIESLERAELVELVSSLGGDKVDRILTIYDRVISELGREARGMEAVILQARIWAGEAKTQKATVDEVGRILGGIPDWGPIAKGLKDRLDELEELHKWRIDVTSALQVAGGIRYDEVERKIKEIVEQRDRADEIAEVNGVLHWHLREIIADNDLRDDDDGSLIPPSLDKSLRLAQAGEVISNWIRDAGENRRAHGIESRINAETLPHLEYLRKNPCRFDFKARSEAEGWKARIAEIAGLFNCPDAPTTPETSNVPNLVRDLISRNRELFDLVKRFHTEVSGEEWCDCEEKDPEVPCPGCLARILVDSEKAGFDVPLRPGQKKPSFPRPSKILPCRYVFKGAQCGYTGPFTTCDKSFESCRYLGNEKRFPEFPQPAEEIPADPSLFPISERARKVVEDLRAEERLGVEIEKAFELPPGSLANAPPTAHELGKEKVEKGWEELKPILRKIAQAFDLKEIRINGVPALIEIDDPEEKKGGE